MNIKNVLEKKLQENPFQSLTEALYEILLHMIVRFHLPPHSMVSVKQIADICQTSKTPVKNAVDLLEEEGFVYKIKNKGAFVAPFEYEDYVNGHKLRTALEIAASKKAGLLMEESDFMQLRQIATEVQEAYAKQDISKIYALEQAFHLKIVSHSQNPHMIEAYKDLIKRLHRLSFYIKIDAQIIAELNKQHFEICDALERRDERLIQTAMSRHRLRLPIDYENIADDCDEKMEK